MIKQFTQFNRKSIFLQKRFFRGVTNLARKAQKLPTPTQMLPYVPDRRGARIVPSFSREILKNPISNTQYKELYSQYKELYSQYKELYSQYKELYSQYKELYSQYKELQSQYKELYSQYKELYSFVDYETDVSKRKSPLTLPITLFLFSIFVQVIFLICAI